MARHPPPDDEIFEPPPPGGLVDYMLVRHRVRQLEHEVAELAMDVDELRKAMTDEAAKQLERQFSLRLQRPIVVIGACGLILNLAAVFVALGQMH